MSTTKKIDLSALDETLLENLSTLMTKTDLSQLELEQDGLRIRLQRGGTLVAQAAPTAAPAPAAPIATSGTPAAAAEATGPDLSKALKAPLVGTFYSAPAPDAKSFVAVGGTVKKGQTVGIIEAMKTMNPVEADRDGTVKELLISDAEPVEFGQPLLIIE